MRTASFRVLVCIGPVSCVYVHPQSGNFWVLDYDLFDPQGDGKTKLDHVGDMVASLTARQVLYQTVLMDTWYATTELMLSLDSLGKTFYCPLKSNRQVDDNLMTVVGSTRTKPLANGSGHKRSKAVVRPSR